MIWSKIAARQPLAHLACEEAATEARSFDDVERAGDRGGIVRQRCGAVVRQGDAQVGEVGRQRRAAAALGPIGEDRLRAGSIQRRLGRRQRLGMRLEEAGIAGGVGEVEAREQAVEPLMRLGCALAERAVRGFQAASPNTRAKIVSTCL